AKPGKLPDRERLVIRMEPVEHFDKPSQQELRIVGRCPAARLPCELDDAPLDIENIIVEAAVEEVAVTQREDVLQTLLVRLDFGLDVDQPCVDVVPVVGYRASGLRPVRRGEPVASIAGHDDAYLLETLLRGSRA